VLSAADGRAVGGNTAAAHTPSAAGERQHPCSCGHRACSRRHLGPNRCSSVCTFRAVQCGSCIPKCTSRGSWGAYRRVQPPAGRAASSRVCAGVRQLHRAPPACGGQWGAGASGPGGLGWPALAAAGCSDAAVVWPGMSRDMDCKGALLPHSRAMLVAA
jgi:hypothetical protein